MKRQTILMIVYYAYLVIVVLLLTYCMRHISGEPLLDPLSPTSTSLQSMAIMYVLISIPLSFWGFSRLIKTYRQQGIDEELLAKRHFLLSIMRMTLLMVGACACICLFLYIHQKSMLWCGAMPVVAYCFCKPTQQRIDMELNQS